MTEHITVAAAVGRTLAACGADHVFGVIGSGNFQLTRALVEQGVGFTSTRHEMGAASMADAYGRVSGRLAVVSVHQGCGLTNALTGIAEAVKSHTPMIVVSGDTARGDTTSNFYIDQDAAATAIGATPARVSSAQTAIAETARAVYLATAERRTVIFSVPIDIQEAVIEWDPAFIPPRRALSSLEPSDADLERLVNLLAHAQRPVIVAGRGAWGARDELRALAEAAGALVVTSAAARGLFHGEEWALDIMGGFATDDAADLIAAADVIAAFGVGLNNWTTRGGELLSTATVIQIDDVASAIGRHIAVGHAVIGDVAVVAAAAAARLEQREPRIGYRTPDVAARVVAGRYWKDQPLDSRTKPGSIDPAELAVELDRMLPLERIVVPDGGNVNAYCAYFRVPDERGFCVPLSFQSIGLGLASAIGAGVAQPDRLPIVVGGDGAFMMSHVELDTALRLGLGMVVVVLNDDAYGAEVHIFDAADDEHGLVHFPPTDIAAIARGYGCDAVTVRSSADLSPVATWLDGPRDRPLVIDAKIAGFPSYLMQRGMH
jgi:thiamine pyrophosphate-dependent acetolactate synthase large subunit-like protein